MSSALFWHTSTCMHNKGGNPNVYWVFMERKNNIGLPIYANKFRPRVPGANLLPCIHPIIQIKDLCNFFGDLFGFIFLGNLH